MSLALHPHIRNKSKVLSIRSLFATHPLLSPFPIGTFHLASKRPFLFSSQLNRSPMRRFANKFDQTLSLQIIRVPLLRVFMSLLSIRKRSSFQINRMKSWGKKVIGEVLIMQRIVRIGLINSKCWRLFRSKSCGCWEITRRERYFCRIN